jgi:hypothetical protein
MQAAQSSTFRRVRSLSGRPLTMSEIASRAARSGIRREARAADCEVELGFLFPRNLAIHVLYLALEQVTVDERARLCLWQRLCESNLVLGCVRIRAHCIPTWCVVPAEILA